jgi:hypothetical protein
MRRYEQAVGDAFTVLKEAILQVDAEFGAGYSRRQQPEFAVALALRALNWMSFRRNYPRV